MKKRSILAGAFTLLVLISLVRDVSAITGRIGSSRMTLNLDVGEVARRSIVIENVNGVPLTINLSASGDLKDNLILEEPYFILNPGESKEAEFTIFANESGTTETKINVYFIPAEGSGVGLSATIIVVARDSDSDSRLEINSPSEEIYNEKRVQFNISLSEPVDKITYTDLNDARPTEKTLCNGNCQGYGDDRPKFQTFNDGWHKLIFKAIIIKDNMTTESPRTVEFMVDSKDPRILRTEPRKGFTSGLFSINFKEDNPTQLTLFCGSESWDIDLSSCYPDRGDSTCEARVNLDDFDGQEISCYFELEDIAENVDESRPVALRVDTTQPVINSFDYSINRRSVEFDFDISEDNFDKIIYVDSNDAKQTEKTLCSRLQDGVCHVRKTFRTGEHNLTINVFDKAGNSETENAQFTID